jgi:hypothetical protein
VMQTVTEPRRLLLPSEIYLCFSLQYRGVSACFGFIRSP